MTVAPLLIGHRGAPRLARENTVASFHAALEAGLDGLETDVQRTADGVLVLHHDPALADGSFIAWLESSAVRNLAPDLPFLDDLLPLLIDFPTARVNLELKTAAPYDDARAADLSSALAAWPATARERTWLSSFDPLLLLALAESLEATGVEMPLAFLMGSWHAERLLPVLPVAAVHPHHSLVDEGRVHGWHERRLTVNAWTINDPDLALRLLDAGVDGLIGDVPEVLLAARSAGA